MPPVDFGTFRGISLPVYRRPSNRQSRVPQRAFDDVAIILSLSRIRLAVSLNHRPIPPVRRGFFYCATSCASNSSSGRACISSRVNSSSRLQRVLSLALSISSNNAAVAFTYLTTPARYSFGNSRSAATNAASSGSNSNSRSIHCKTASFGSMNTSPTPLRSHSGFTLHTRHIASKFRLIQF